MNGYVLMGFLTEKGLTAKDLVSSQKGKLISLNVNATTENAVKIMSENNFSQPIVTNEGRIIGFLNEYYFNSQTMKNHCK